jgi:hypothetical protein
LESSFLGIFKIIEYLKRLQFILDLNLTLSKSAKPALSISDNGAGVRQQYVLASKTSSPYSAKNKFV